MCILACNMMCNYCNNNKNENNNNNDDDDDDDEDNDKNLLVNWTRWWKLRKTHKIK